VFALDKVCIARSVTHRMNTKQIACPIALVFTLSLFVGTGIGCKSQPRKNTTPVVETQAPTVVKPARSTTDPTEKRLQEQINLMQEQLGPLTARVEALSRFHGNQMNQKWSEKVQKARDEASDRSERLRYLEATKALLSRRLQALRTELKVYEEFELSDPTIPRP
jgi:TolA-binding protein